MEFWKNIEEYPGYQISSLGRVKSFRRYKEGRILKNIKNDKGYYKVNLYKDKKMITAAVHRLVAEAFIPNPNHYEQVNHKDENPSNNCVDNLEWCDAAYNIGYGLGNQRRKENQPKIGKGKNILCVEDNKTFTCIGDAADYYGVTRGAIKHVLHGRNKTCANKHFIEIKEGD